jgi:hypothetical protein
VLRHQDAAPDLVVNWNRNHERAHY